MKSHIPWRTVKSNPFNKDKFKGNYEEIQDWDLPKKVYVYEPQTLAELGDEATELDYQKVWNNFRAGGHIFIYLVPYKEAPEIDIDITSEAADWQGLNKEGVISGYTNIQLPKRPTKRFYSFEKLEPSDEVIDIEFWEENNLSEVIDNDGGFKQTTFTFTKFQTFDGGEESYYRDVRFFYGIAKPKDIQYVQVEQDFPAINGSFELRGTKGNNINKNLEVEIKERDPATIINFPHEWKQDASSQVVSGEILQINVPNARDISNVVLQNDTATQDVGNGTWVLYSPFDFTWEVIDSNTIEIWLKYDKQGTNVVGYPSGYFQRFDDPVNEFGDDYKSLEARYPDWHVFEFYIEDQLTYISLGKIEGNTIIYNPEDQVHPQLIVPRTSGAKLIWNAPWVWEYMYAKEQFDGEFKYSFLTGGSNDNKVPKIAMQPKYTFDKRTVEYNHLIDSNLTETAKELPFFLPYAVEFGLPRGLSSHGSVYVNSASNDSNGGFLNLNYTDTSQSGARPDNSESGTWVQRTTIFALDLAYDPTIFSVGGSLDIYLSKIVYGDFFGSKRYVKLMESILDENAIYDGIPFMSSLGVLKDIENMAMDRDIRKWNIDGDWLLGLLPLSPIELSEGYLDSNPKYLDSTLSVGRSTPKIDTGVFDFNPASVQSNATQPFFGKFIEEQKIIDNNKNGELNRTFLLKPIENDVSQISINYSAFSTGNFRVKTFSKIDNTIIETYQIELPNEKSQGRNLSGGTVITWL